MIPPRQKSAEAADDPAADNKTSREVRTAPIGKNSGALVNGEHYADQQQGRDDLPERVHVPKPAPRPAPASAYDVGMDLAILNRLEAEGKMPAVEDTLAQMFRMMGAPASTPLDAFALVSAAHGLIRQVSGHNDLLLMVDALLSRAIVALEQATSTPNERFCGVSRTEH